MWTKRILVFLPIAVCLFLAQSYFWVPTYSEQAEATPERLKQYITGSIGDAQILNPILNADSASGQITGMVFEGLIDRDKDLNWRGRLAERWEITEEAYFVVRPGDGRPPEQIAELLRAAVEGRKDEDSDLGRTLRDITAIEVEPAEPVTEKFQDLPPVPEGEQADSEAEPEEVTVTAERPPRIKLTLTKVDQYLFDRIEPLLGEHYFTGWDPAELLTVTPAKFAAKKPAYVKRVLPPVEHNPVIVFHLRPGVKFHDGEPVTAVDVKFTYDAIMNPKNLSPRVPDYEPVKRVEVVDPLTVRVVYKELYSPGFGSWGMGILPEHLLNREALRKEALRRGLDASTFSLRESEFGQAPVGCGPFQFREWQHDEVIRLDRFDDYWEGPPEYATYVFRIIPDPLTQEMEFYSGAIDGYGAQPYQASRLRDDPRFQSFSALAYGYDYIGYNMRRELFKDPRVRRALGMAIPVDKIIQHVLYGEAERITGPFPKQTPFYDERIEPLPYDPDGALKLLEEAGWTRNRDGWLEKDGKRFAFTLITNNGNDIRKAILAVAQDSWKKIGVDVSTDTIEWSVFLDKYIDQGDFDACILGWAMGIEPDLYQIWHSSQTHPYQLNFVGFQNAEADDLIIRIRQEYDHEEQVRLCHRLHTLIAAEQPYTFIDVRKTTALLDRRIVIAVRGKDGRIVGYRRIKATKTGNYQFDFNQWIKLPEVPAEFLEE